MTFPAPEQTPHERAAHAGEVLREAASALYAAEHEGDADASTAGWMALSFPSKTRWGIKVAPAVMATIVVTKPAGWLELTAEITAIASAWARSLGEEGKA